MSDHDTLIEVANVLRGMARSHPENLAVNFQLNTIANAITGYDHTTELYGESRWPLFVKKFEEKGRTQT